MNIKELEAQDAAALIERVSASARAYIQGDMRRYVDLIPHTTDCTLFPPYGGGAVRGFDASDEHLNVLEQMFQGGEATVEIAQAQVSGDLVVLVLIERQHGLVGDFPDQDWSLRVTLGFRRVDGKWHQFHRHADPLVKGISMEEMSAIAKR